MNQFLIKVLKLWEEQKRTGLVIETCRQIGKTTAALEIVAREVEKGNKVLFYVNKQQRADKLHDEFIKYNGFKCVDMIKFKTINDERELDFIPTYTIYDEVILRMKPDICDRIKEKNTIKFFTEIQNGYYRFDYTWSKVNIRELHAQLDEERFEKEYKCCIVE